MTDHLDERLLHDCADDTLAPADRADVATHLAGCAACREDVDRIRRVRLELSTLQRDIAPPAHLLRAINAEIDGAAAPARVAGADRHSTPRASPYAAPARGWYVRPRTLAAAAVLLVALSAGTTTLVLRPRAQVATATPASEPAALAHPASASIDAGMDLGAVQAMERTYEAAISPLEHSLGEEQSELSPETVRVLQANIAIIDRALAEARAALRADPTNVSLAALVRFGYERKLDVLRSANAHARAQS